MTGHAPPYLLFMSQALISASFGRNPCYLQALSASEPKFSGLIEPTQVFRMTGPTEWMTLAFLGFTQELRYLDMGPLHTGLPA